MYDACIGYFSPNQVLSKGFYIKIKHRRIPVSKLLPLKMAFLVVDVTAQFTEWFQLVIVVYCGSMENLTENLVTYPTKKAFCQSYLLFSIR